MIGTYKGKIARDKPDSILHWQHVLGEHGRRLDVFYLGMIKAFDIITHNIFIDRLIKTIMDKWTMSWTKTSWTDNLRIVE